MAANLSEAVADLKRHYNEVHVIGSLDLLQSLLRNRLVDRLSHWLYPPVLEAAGGYSQATRCRPAYA